MPSAKNIAAPASVTAPAAAAALPKEGAVKKAKGKKKQVRPSTDLAKISQGLKIPYKMRGDIKRTLPQLTDRATNEVLLVCKTLMHARGAQTFSAKQFITAIKLLYRREGEDNNEIDNIISAVETSVKKYNTNRPRKAVAAPDAAAAAAATATATVVA